MNSSISNVGKVRGHNRAVSRLLLLVTAVGFLLAVWPPQRAFLQVSASKGKLTNKAKDNLAESFVRLPLAFEKNRGQVNSQAKFIARGSRADVYLSESQIVLNLLKTPPGGTTAENHPGNFPKSNAQPAKQSKPTDSSREIVKIKLIGSSPQKVTGLDELPGTVNYFFGNNPRNWLTDIQTFGKVKFERVYPGIDQIFYGDGQQLEYDFVVSPGANPTSIRFSFEGDKSLTIDSQGDLVLQTKNLNEIRLRKPIAYQNRGGTRHEVAVHFVVRDPGQIGFALGDYDHRKPLIIDPVVSYASYFGGSGNDTGFDIAVDASGNSFITGSTDSTELSSSGGTNAFVAKLNPAGTQRLYLAILGGAGNDTGFSVATDSSGAVYISGATDSTDFPLTNASQLSFGGGAQDAFIAKLNAAGSNVAYSTYLGGSGNDSGFGIAVDSNGSAYVAGSTDSTEFSTLGNSDAFVAKLSSSGSQRTYLSILGGSGDDTAFDIAVDSGGSASIVGTTDSSNFTVANALQPKLGGGLDAFVAKLNPSGSALTYSTYLGGAGNDSAFGVGVDPVGNTYITGSTDSPEFSTLGGRDTFVAKFSAAGDERNYFTILGGSGDDAGFCIAVDSTGNSYVTGSTDSSNFTTTNPIQVNLGGLQDAFIAKLSPTGSTLSYSTFMGSTGNESGFAIAADGAGSAYVTGFTSSTDFPTVTPLQPTNGGNGDAFVLKLSISASPPTMQFSSSAGSVNETLNATTKLDLTVLRGGDNSGEAMIDYATADGTASERSDYLSAIGTLHFASGETAKTVSVFVVDDRFGESQETFTVNLFNPIGCSLGSPPTVTVTINSNESVNGTNPVKDASFNSDFFVRQHYLDFFNREPDAGGLAFWKNQIDECTTQECREIRRINVSAAFFLSIEFQQTGYLVERLYKTAYGGATGSSTLGGTHQLSVPTVRLNEFLPDTQQIGKGVIIGQPGADQTLENNKRALIDEFVLRPRFLTTYPSSMTATQFVDALNTNAGVVLSPTERNQLISDLSTGVKTRAQVLRAVAEDSDLFAAETNRAFVLAQFFGYLRRNPNDLPDADYTGYDFWLGKLNQFNGNFVNAEMVKAFIVSGEYQQRFGP